MLYPIWITYVWGDFHVRRQRGWRGDTELRLLFKMDTPWRQLLFGMVLQHLRAWNRWTFSTRDRCSRWHFHFPVTVLVQGRRSKMKLRLVTEVTELWVRRVEYDCMAAFGLRLFIHSGASAFLPRLIPARLNPCLKSRVWTVRRLAAARSFNPLPARLSGVYSRSSCAVTEYQLATRQSVSVKSALQCQAPFGSAGV